MRGGRETTGDSVRAAGFAADRERRRPGINSRTPSSIARNAAHITQSTPRSNGSRDCGSAGYGLAPVKRRRRPVTDGGVGARFVGSLMTFPENDGLIRRLDSESLRDHCDDESAAKKGTLPASDPVRATGVGPCHARRRRDSRQSERLDRCFEECRTTVLLVRANPRRRTRHLHR